MTDKNLQVLPCVLFNPEKDTDKAKRAADRLIDIVRQNKWSVKVGQGEHLMYEAWQTVGKYYNFTVATGDVEPVELNNVQGFKAKAWVIDNKSGMRVGEAEAYCLRDEPNWKTKPIFQLASMAQTRAGSKALRQIFGFVVALAGYNPTPAEEMIGQDPTWITDGDKTLPTTPLQTYSVPLASDKQVRMIYGLLSQKGMTEDQLKIKYHVDSVSKLEIPMASQIIDNLLKLPDKAGTIPEVDIKDK